MITIIDYGAGNIKSIKNMLKKLGVESIISNQASIITQAEKLILPGVGHFDHGMINLRNSQLVEVIKQKVQQEKIPILGICLGAQLLGTKSQEGAEPGLDLISMEIERFDKTKLPVDYKIPHMGWNKLKVQENYKSHKIMEGVNEDSRYYFVHSYYMYPHQKANTLSTTDYGIEFSSAVINDNIFGFQFHPEKSHVFGMQLLKNFASI